MTTPLVLFPDAELLVADELRAQLAKHVDPDIVAGTLVPSPRPDRLVVVQRLGGSRRDLVTDGPTLTVEAWAPSADEAHDIAQHCRAFIHALRGSTLGGFAVYRVDEVSGPQSLPDPLSANPRYALTVVVAIRGAALDLTGS